MNSQIKGLGLFERMLIREINPDRALFRIVRVDDDAGIIWLFNVAEKLWPEPFKKDVVRARLHAQTPDLAIEYTDPYPINFSEEDRDLAAFKTRDRNWGVVEHLLSNDLGRALLFKSTRKSRIDDAIEKCGVTRPTVVTAIMRYWQRGMTPDALRSDYANCGGPGKTRSIESGRKVGRPRTIAEGVGISVNDDLRRKMRIGADFYLTESKPSLQRALNYVVELFYSHHVEKNGRMKVELSDDRPTLKQFSYYVRTSRAENQRFKARHGQKKFDLEARELLGKADQNAKGPGDEFQVDATIADVYLRSQFDRRRTVGRPVIYFVIDVWSRLITGVYIGFEGPSWIGAMMALTNMVTPKVEYCRQYGIEIEPEEWPSHHAPRAILADRGELMSVDLGKRIVDTIRIQIGNTAPGRGDLKAIVESRFRIIPAIFKQFTPGYVEPDFGSRGARDYRLESAMDLRDFTKIVIRSVLQHNRGKVGGINVPTEMTTDGMSLREMRYDEVALAVMPRETARVTANGIRFKGAYYTCDRAKVGNWFFKARREEWSIEVAFDPRSLDKLYLLDKKLPRGFEACMLTEPYQELVGKTLSEYEEKELAAKRLAAKEATAIQAMAIETDIAMRAIQKEAIEKTREVQDPGATRKSQVAAIQKNHVAEKAFQRPIERIDLAPISTVPTFSRTTPVQSIVPADDPPDTYEADMLSALESVEEAGENRR